MFTITDIMAILRYDMEQVVFTRDTFKNPEQETASFTFFSLSLSSMTVYSSRAPNTKMMQAMTQHSIAVSPSAYKVDIDRLLGNLRDISSRQIVRETPLLSKQ